MVSQRAVLGTGLAILLIISAASIGLDVKSRSDAIWVDHTLAVLQKFSDMRFLITRAVSASRGFMLTSNPNYVVEFNETRDRIGPALDELIETTRDNRAQTQLLENSRELITRRLAVSGELVRLHAAGDSAGIAALNATSEGRAAMDAISANFDRLAAEEQRLLAIRSAEFAPDPLHPAGDRPGRRAVDPLAGRDPDPRRPPLEPDHGDLAERLQGRKRNA